MPTNFLHNRHPARGVKGVHHETLLRLTAAVLIALTYVLLPLPPDAVSGTWVESTTPNPNELPSTSGQVVVFNFSISHDYEVSVRYQAQAWNGYLGEDAMTINYEAKYRISVFEPQQNGDVKQLFHSNTNWGNGTIGSGETFHGHNSASYDASGLPAGIEVKAEASTEVTVDSFNRSDG